MPETVAPEKCVQNLRSMVVFFLIIIFILKRRCIQSCIIPQQRRKFMILTGLLGVTVCQKLNTDNRLPNKGTKLRPSFLHYQKGSFRSLDLKIQCELHIVQYQTFFPFSFFASLATLLIALI